MKEPYVCPARFAGSLDNFIRRWIHKPFVILKPYIKTGMDVLDLGCGPGYFTTELAEMVGDEGKVIAADLQQEMLDRMAMKIMAAGLEKRMEAHLCKADSTGLSRKFDFILAFWMIHEVPDQLKLFSELRSLLKPGGRLLIAEPKIHVTSKSFNSMLGKAMQEGFKLVETPAISISRAVVLTTSDH